MASEQAKWGAIEVRGARENNLRDVSLDIPKHRLTVFTGVSGSGKSSLVFQTIAAESRRLINETYTSFVQSFMGTPARPDVDSLENLSPAIVIGQERMGANIRSTVGTLTDANALLRIVFSRLGQPQIGSPQAFAFNVPSVHGAGAMTVQRGPGKGKVEKRTFTVTGGMCPRCEGVGSVSDIDLTQLYDETKSIAGGAITIPGYTADGWQVRMIALSGFVDPDKPIRDFSPKELDAFLYHEPTKAKIGGINITVEGLVLKVRKSYLSKDVNSMQPHIRAFVERIATFTTCPDCGGSRLNESARSSKIKGVNMAEACAMQISDLAEWVRGIDEPSVAPIVAGLRQTLDSFVEIGLGYLSLDRASGTLSGGEAQRTRMIRNLSSSLTDMTYIFDEPTIGLHAHDVHKMNALLERLRDKGNTVLVVEHDPQVIRIADHVVDMGPGAGPHGGEVVFEGDLDGLIASDTATGRHLNARQALKDEVRQATRRDRDPQRAAAQPQGRLGRRAAGRPRRDHRRRRLGQELAHPRLHAAPRAGSDGHRPVGHPRLAALQPGDLHRHPRPDPEGLRDGQWRQARFVQRQLRGRLPGLQRPGHDLHRARLHGRGRVGLRGVRGPPLHRRGARLPPAREVHRRRAGDVGRGGARLLQRASPCAPCSSGWPTWGWVTSRSARSSTRCRAASASG